MTPSRRAFWRVVWAPGWTGSRRLPTCPTRRPDTPPDPLQTPSRELGLTPSREGTFEAFSGLPKVHVFGQLFGSFWRLIFAKKNAKKSAKKVRNYAHFSAPFLTRNVARFLVEKLSLATL